MCNCHCCFWTQELNKRVAVNVQHPPSSCFFTFVNTRQTLNCVDFSWDAARVVGGFSDSSIRIYDLKRMAAEQLSEEFLNELDIDEEELMSRAVTQLWGHSGETRRGGTL